MLPKRVGKKFLESVGVSTQNFLRTKQVLKPWIVVFLQLYFFNLKENEDLLSFGEQFDFSMTALVLSSSNLYR